MIEMGSDRNRRFMLLLMTVISFALPSWAVLPENNIDRTLIMLSSDMKVLEQNISNDLLRFEKRQSEFRNTINQLSEECDETGVVLYSQDERYLYGSLQATQSMKNVISRIKSQKKTIVLLENDLHTISQRYGELSEFLRQLGSRSLSDEGHKALVTSQNIADSLKNSLQVNITSLYADKKTYNELLAHADKLETYNSKVLSSLQIQMFSTGNENIEDLFRHFPDRWQEFTADFQWHFTTGQINSEDWKTQKNRLNELLGINNYVAIFVALCFFFITRIKRFCPSKIRGKRLYYSLILGLIVVQIGLIVISSFIGEYHNFNSILLIESEIYLVALTIVAYLTLRLPRKDIWRALLSYLPIFFLTNILLVYREDQYPLSTVTVTMPFLFFIALITQLIILFKSRKKLDQKDRNMAWANLGAITVGFICICVGYTILATMIFLMWIGIITGFMLLSIGKIFIAKRNPKPSGVLGLTIRLFIYPLALPAIMLMAFTWVAHIYNLTIWFGELLRTPFLNMPDTIGVVSIAKLLLIYGLGIFVNYVLCLVKTMLRCKVSYRQEQVAVWTSVGRIVVWILYIVAVMVILDINKVGLAAAVGGASVGVGFALKDTLENLFSGISLMTGRLRPGDILEYEGVRGKVLDIGITSTTMETEDGPIMTLPNRQLFEKNFKNMTRNHRVELRHITFDISAENDPKAVRALILACLMDISGVDNSRKHVVIIRNFGSGVMRVELKVWIDSEMYLAAEPAVREAVFEAFRANGIRKATFIEQVESNGSSNIMTNNRTII